MGIHRLASGRGFWWLAAAAVFVLSSVAVAFWIVRDSDAVTRAGGPAAPDTPGPLVSRPGVTPDANQENLQPPFKGTLNGFEIDPDYVDSRTGFDGCPGTGFMDPPPGRSVETVVNGGPYAIDPRSMPEGVTPDGLPYPVLLCGGELRIVSWTFNIAAGTPDVNPRGGWISISRRQGLLPVPLAAPADRWFGITVGGRPAIVLRRVVTVGAIQLGGCYAATYNPDHDVFTDVISGTANAEFCIAVLERVVR